MAARSSPNMAAVTLVAGLAGAGLALLFAPRSGRETRERIQERTDELKDRAQDSLHDMKDTVSSGMDKFSSSVRSTGKRAEREFDELKDDTDRPVSRQSPVLHTWEEEV